MRGCSVFVEKTGLIRPLPTVRDFLSVTLYTASIRLRNSAAVVIKEAMKKAG
jgi:G3E family GTPase